MLIFSLINLGMFIIIYLIFKKKIYHFIDEFNNNQYLNVLKILEQSEQKYFNDYEKSKHELFLISEKIKEISCIKNHEKRNLNHKKRNIEQDSIILQKTLEANLYKENYLKEFEKLLEICSEKILGNPDVIEKYNSEIAKII